MIKTQKTKHGKFIPKFPEKYKGKYPIIIRSSWERMYCQWLDVNQSIIEWTSEGICINYNDPINIGNIRRYYPDFFIKIKNKQNEINKYIIEIKPYKEIIPPNIKGKIKNSTKIYREHTYMVNMAKFKAAKEYCKKMGYNFKILTEKELFRKNK